MLKATAGAALILAAPFLILSACNRNDPAPAHRGNQSLARMESLEAEAKAKHGLQLRGSAQDNAGAIGAMDAREARQARALLSEYISLGEEALRIAQRPDVRFSDADTLNGRIQKARVIRASIERRANQLGVDLAADASARQGTGQAAAAAESEVKASQETTREGKKQ